VRVSPLGAIARPLRARSFTGVWFAVAILAAVLTYNTTEHVPRAAAAGDPTIATAGDIACDPTNTSFNGGAGTSANCRQLATSELLVGKGYSAVLPLGDNQYYCGGLTAFQQSYDTSWGRVKSITRPVVGNHEYLTSGGLGCDSTNAGASGYFNYFGAAAGTRGQGWYSYDIGTWHIVALNSNCGDAGGCGATSPQGKWLANDLATHRNACTLAYWHIPLFSSGGRASPNTLPFWQQLYNSGADVILSGHDHVYERFAPQDPAGHRDDARGMREFIVGTGGANHTTFPTTAPNSEVRNATTYGVLQLTLHAGSYDWKFVPEAGASFTDSGTAACVGATDTVAPSVPSGLVVSTSGSGASVSWSASSDNVGVAGYNVYVGGVRAGSAMGTSFNVSGLSCGTSYEFGVEAFDAAGNVSPRALVSASTAACAPAALFSDGFESGDVSRWSANFGLVADASQAHSGSFGGRATSSGPTAAYAYAQLSAEQTTLDTTLWFKVVSLGANVVDVAKLRTGSGAALLTVFVSPTGVLGYQNNVTTVSTYSTAAVSSGGWHKLQVRTVINGASSQVSTWLDDQPVGELTKTESLGTTGVGRVQIGENITGRTYDLALDDVTIAPPT
jgi:Fibronectin type III domain/Calcineurin-like phosphoesterase